MMICTRTSSIRNIFGDFEILRFFESFECFSKTLTFIFLIRLKKYSNKAVNNSFLNKLRKLNSGCTSLLIEKVIFHDLIAKFTLKL